MSVHRYSPLVELTATQIASYAPSGGSVVRRTLTAIDVSLVNDLDKPGFDEYMASLGAAFVTTAPVGATYQPFENGITTPDATPAVALSIPTVDGRSYLVNANVAARNGASGVSGGFVLIGMFRRDVGAASLVQIGLTSVVSQLLQNPAWLATFQVTALGDIELLVTGSAGATITWYCGALVTETP